MQFWPIHTHGPRDIYSKCICIGLAARLLACVVRRIRSTACEMLRFLARRVYRCLSVRESNLVSSKLDCLLSGQRTLIVQYSAVDVRVTGGGSQNRIRDVDRVACLRPCPCHAVYTGLQTCTTFLKYARSSDAEVLLSTPLSVILVS